MTDDEQDQEQVKSETAAPGTRRPGPYTKETIQRRIRELKPSAHRRPWTVSPDFSVPTKPLE